MRTLEAPNVLQEEKVWRVLSAFEDGQEVQKAHRPVVVFVHLLANPTEGLARRTDGGVGQGQHGQRPQKVLEFSYFNPAGSTRLRCLGESAATERKRREKLFQHTY